MRDGPGRGRVEDERDLLRESEKLASPGRRGNPHGSVTWGAMLTCRAMLDVIRIANAGGYWGDDLAQFKRQIELGPVDFVTLDFLAEITMSIMQKQRVRDARTGYARDFVAQVEEALPLLAARGTRVITNAGGVNPLGCRGALLEMANLHGQSLEIAAVIGDDLMPRLGELNAAGVTLDNMEDGARFLEVRDRVSSANAYYGAWPVVDALASRSQSSGFHPKA